MHRLLAAAAALVLVPLLLAAPAQADGQLLGGRITAPDGSPVADARVTVVAASARGTPVATADADADGSWSVTVPDGDYLVHVADPTGTLADGWWRDASSSSQAGAVRVTGGAVTLEPEQVLPEGGAVAGTVRSAGGPVGGVTATIARTPFLAVATTTASDGSFRLDGVRAGAQQVEVLTGDRPLAGEVHTVEVVPDAVAEVGFILRPRPIGVERVAGPDRVATAVEASRRGFVAAPAVVIAGATQFPDALAASPMAADVGGPLLLVGPRLAPVVIDEIRRLGAQEAVIVGAIGAVPLIVQEELGRLGLDVRRIAGENRFDTAALIARDLGSPDGRVIVAGGLSFADALSVAPYAAAERIPILLTGPDTLHPDAAAALRAIGATESVVVGGSGVVSDAVLAALPSATRVSGPERYATSLAIAAYWAERDMRLETVHVATGRDFPDALAAGPVAALARGPLLLVDGLSADAPDATYAWLRERRDEIDGAYAFGGNGVMVEPVLQRLRDAIGDGG